MSTPENQVAAADFAELPRSAAGGTGQLNLDLIMDVRLVLTLEVGRTRISVRNLLALTQGSVVELDKLAGEPLDVLVNGTLVAHGEVVVVNDAVTNATSTAANTISRAVFAAINKGAADTLVATWNHKNLGA